MDRIALVTGATSGVGVVVAKRLAREGWFVLPHGRDQARGAQVVGDIKTAGGQARFYGADLSSMEGVRALAEAVARDHRHLHLLINNAGIGFGPPDTTRQEGPDGFELRFAVNYLAPFLLTRLLLPKLLAAAPARIVNVASIGQRDLDFDDLQLERHYSGRDAYRQSKLALIMFTFDSRRGAQEPRCHRQRTAPGDVHGHVHGTRSRRRADEHRGRRRGRDHESRRLGRDARTHRGIFRWPASRSRAGAGL